MSRGNKRKNGKAGLKELWVDGCFLDQEGLAGGGAVICDFGGNILSTMSFDLNCLNITESVQSEFWTAISALQNMQTENLGRIICDNQQVVKAMERIRTGGALKFGLDERIKQDLSQAVLEQPQMMIVRIADGKNRPRNQGKTPIADGFAKAAAKGCEALIEKQVRRCGRHAHQHFVVSVPK